MCTGAYRWARCHGLAAGWPLVKPGELHTGAVGKLTLTMAGAASGRAAAKGQAKGIGKGNKKRQSRGRKCKSKQSKNQVTSSPVDGNTAPTPELINKSLSELLAPPTPMPDNSDNGDSPGNPVLFASYIEQDKNATDEQPAMNASLINIFNLESDLAATRLVVEENELEIAKLKKDNNALRSDIEQYKKTDTNQKLKLKKLLQENDNLKRELSKFSGIRRYTVENHSDNQPELNKIRDELNMTKAKLASLQDSVKTYAERLLEFSKVSPNEPCSANDIVNDNRVLPDFQIVTRGRKRIAAVPEGQSEGHASAEEAVSAATPSRVITRPSGPPSEPQRQGTTQQPTQCQQSQAGPKNKTYAHALQERLPDTVVIGTSLVRGVGDRLRERGIDNCVYCLPGAELPLIHKKLGDILIPGKIPKNIIIQAAGNDIGRHWTDMVVQEYDKLINTLKSKCPKSNIWLCKIPRRTHLSWLHSEIAKVNTFLQKSSHGKNVRFIDSCPEFGPRYFRRDMTHFTPHGVHVYGDKIACSMINFHINQTNRYR